MNQNYYPQYNYPVQPVAPQPSPAEIKKQAQKQEKHEILTAGFGLGTTIIAYLVVQSIAIFWLKGQGYMSIYEQSSMLQSYFNVIAVHFLSMLLPFGMLALIFRKRFISPVVPTKKVGKAPFWAWVAFGMMTCYLADILVSAMITAFKQFGYELTKSETLKPSSIMDCIALIIATAIIPAIIEEIAMRCFGLGILRKHGKGFAVFAISIVFGLLHGNVIQFVFAFCVGLILGFITIKTDSVIPAMLVHGFNNGLSVVGEILGYSAGTKISENVVSILCFSWLIVGIIGTIYLIFTKRLFAKKEKKEKNPYALNFFIKTVCFLPGMIIPLIILIWISAQTIVKI